VVESRSARPTFALLIGIAAAALLLLPLVTTFDDLLTGAAMRVGLDSHIAWLVPAESRMVVAILNAVGVGAVSRGAYVTLAGHPEALFISWNCVGWQSLLLLGLTMMTGLRGGHRPVALLQVVLLGLLGTFLVNIVRVSLVCLLEARAGYLPALLFHDYGGTLLLIAWLFCFWAAAYRWVLLPTSLDTR
jgi:exosortase/archaeosortase family protein